MKPELVTHLISGGILLTLTIIFGIIAYFLKRYIDKQDEELDFLKKENSKMMQKVDEGCKEIIRELEREKQKLLKEVADKDAYIDQRVERRVRLEDCLCQSEEIQNRFATGDKLFIEIKTCLNKLSGQFQNSLQGIHQYTLIMSSTMLSLCKSLGENMECKELEQLHTALQHKKIQHIVEQVEKKNATNN